MTPPVTRAIQAIRGVLSGWFGESERTSEAAVAAEVRRLRAEFSALRQAAGDSPVHPDDVFQELRTMLVPAIWNYAHLFAVTHSRQPGLADHPPCAYRANRFACALRSRC